MSIIEYIKESSHEIYDEVIAFRRDLHQYPELSHQESRTAAKLLSQLEKLPFDEIRTNVGGHGILATLYGKNPDGKTILLRADMDALPIEEKTKLPFISKNAGVMHACGTICIHQTCLEQPGF